MTTPNLIFGAVLSRQHLEYALRDAAMATRTRKNNGLPETPAHCEYVEAPRKALAAGGQMDVPKSPTEKPLPSAVANGPDQASPNPPGPGSVTAPQLPDLVFGFVPCAAWLPMSGLDGVKSEIRAEETIMVSTNPISQTPTPHYAPG
jgi:hypothetical protein